nr:MAG TPA: hypothetical protein [Caudoviricetes sp.]DAN15859.1 MAG TPA: hypothetical protein [Caudoviricetes sp.]
MEFSMEENEILGNGEIQRDENEFGGGANE